MLNGNCKVEDGMLLPWIVSHALAHTYTFAKREQSFSMICKLIQFYCTFAWHKNICNVHLLAVCQILWPCSRLDLLLFCWIIFAFGSFVRSFVRFLLLLLMTLSQSSFVQFVELAVYLMAFVFTKWIQHLFLCNHIFANLKS